MTQPRAFEPRPMFRSDRALVMPDDRVVPCSCTFWLSGWDESQHQDKCAVMKAWRKHFALPHPRPRKKR